MAALTPKELEALGLPLVATSPPLNTDGRLTTAERQAIDDAKATGTLGGWVQDILQSAGSGVEQGVAGLPGVGGDTFDLLNALVGAGEKFVGVPEEQRDARYQDVAADRLLPNSEDVRSAFTDSDPYRPKSATGRAAEVAGSLVSGGGLRHIFRDLVLPALGVTAGGNVGEAIAGPEGRLVGELAAGVGTPAAAEASKRAALPRVAPERQRLLNTLRREGVELTGGQATGSKPLRYLEAGPFNDRPEAVADQQSRQFSRAALRTAGIDEDAATPDVMARAQDRFGNSYDSLVARANGITMDPQLMQALTDIGSNYETLKSGPGTPAVGSFFNRIVDAAAQGGGVIPPQVYASIRSDIARLLRQQGGDPDAKHVLREFQDAMFDSLGRNGQPDVADEWRRVNNQYRNFKIIEKAMTGNSVETNMGFVTPERLQPAVVGSDRTGFTQGAGDLNELARAGSVLKSLPNSGTAARSIPSAVAAVAGGALPSLFSGDPGLNVGSLAAGAAGLVLPGIAGSAVAARPVRTSIVRRAEGINPNYFEPMQLLPLQTIVDDGVSPMPVEEEPTPEQPQTQLQPIEVDPNIPQPVPGTVPRPPQQQAMLDLSRMIGQQLGIGRA